MLRFEDFVPVSGRVRVSVAHCGGYFDHVDLETIWLGLSNNRSMAEAHLASSVINVLETLRQEAVFFVVTSFRWHFEIDRESALSYFVLGFKSRYQGQDMEKVELM